MKLRNLAGLFSERWREPSTCEPAANLFKCGAKLTGCWCAEVKLSEQVRAELRAKYRGCLCRQCLEKFEAAAQQLNRVMNKKDISIVTMTRA
jgi:hypothetical protein